MISANIQHSSYEKQATRVVKGMTNMDVSKEARRFVRNLVTNYARYDSDSYKLHILDLSDFDRHEFASLMMQLDDEIAAEATGLDNPSYQEKMLPALLKHLQNTTNRENEIDFNKAWSQGIASYFDDTLQAMINEECDEYYHEVNNIRGFYK